MSSNSSAVSGATLSEAMAALAGRSGPAVCASILVAWLGLASVGIGRKDR
ncbi:hypothetical protein H6G52_10945 [Limnothrix sp. FACHB-881]|uniref:Uncharacterized protein n=1 Tax=Limnothrix redekei LRLZ20PSL1 TaxID=3112953 RepID=A0ABW7CDW0_9CYAN|nr:hypothetical protein [Limnothrix sp. FACHB-881]MBD2635874.1 hypothetical protein [Limnothrix sp. FACHB-881]